MQSILPSEQQHHAKVLAGVAALMDLTTLAHILDALAETCSARADTLTPDSPAAASWDACAGLILNASLTIKDGTAIAQAARAIRKGA